MCANGVERKEKENLPEIKKKKLQDIQSGKKGVLVGSTTVTSLAQKAEVYQQQMQTGCQHRPKSP